MMMGCCEKKFKNINKEKEYASYLLFALTLVKKPKVGISLDKIAASSSRLEKFLVSKRTGK
jgi:hypothetical protein